MHRNSQSRFGCQVVRKGSGGSGDLLFTFLYFRASIARIHLEPLKTSLDKNNLAKKIALLTDDFTGAKVAATCNEAAMIASRLLADEITIDHFDKSLDRLRRGIQKVTPFTDKDKHVASFHEAGHAVVGWNLENVKPVKKVLQFFQALS